MFSEAMVSNLHASIHLSCIEAVFYLVTTFPYANISCLSNTSVVKVGMIFFLYTVVFAANLLNTLDNLNICTIQILCHKKKKPERLRV